MKYPRIQIVCVLSIAFLAFSCKKDETTTPATPATGSDPNFSIVSNTDADFSSLSKKVVVFEIPIYAVTAVDDNRLLHAANIMAQYLDNDEDGVVDNQSVLDAMHANNSFMVMWKSENDFEGIEPPSNAEGQDLGNDETMPAWHTNGHTGQFDASLEEVLHIITHAGYASAYPSVFGEGIGTDLSNAMDVARGGQFTSIPNPYPAGAWYTYDDGTCNYNCMTTEYIYWALTSLLGAQENRLGEISQEWDLNTASLVENTDVAAYSLLTDPQYNFPTVLPDGTYMH